MRPDRECTAEQPGGGANRTDAEGASGQAVQNMNILFGLDERLGLSSAALLP